MNAPNKRAGAALQVITANRLRDGVVIYLQLNGDHHRWCENLREASIFDAAGIESMLKYAVIDVRENRIVDPYPIGVSENHAPLTQRESIRASGPTIAYMS